MELTSSFKVFVQLIAVLQIINSHLKGRLSSLHLMWQALESVELQKSVVVPNKSGSLASLIFNWYVSYEKEEKKKLKCDPHFSVMQAYPYKHPPSSNNHCMDIPPCLFSSQFSMERASK